MKKKRARFPISKAVTITKNPDHAALWDFDLHNIKAMQRFREVELSVMVYPYSRQITARHVAFTPFEEYVKDITDEQPSAYTRIIDGWANVFGLVLGSSIFLLFYFFKISELLSIESIVSIFGAYLIGKELWDDLENLLIRLTHGKRLRYERSEFSYQRDTYTVLSLYQGAARRHRYGSSTLTPDKMHFVQQSNSQMLRMLFTRKDLKTAGSDSAHLFSMRIPPKFEQAFVSEGAMTTVRLAFVRKFLWWGRSHEFFQSIDGSAVGALDADGTWHSDVVLTRVIHRTGRWRRYGRYSVAGNMRLLDKST